MTASSSTQPPPSRVRSWFRRPIAWFLAIALTAVATTLTGFYTGVIGNWFDSAKVADSFASSGAVKMIKADEYSEHYGWASPNVITPQQILEMESSDVTDATLVRYGAVPLSRERVQITLEGQRAVPTQITRLYPRVVSCGPSDNGTLFLSHPEGVDNNPQLTVNLDQPNPVFLDGSDSGQSSSPPSPYFDSHSFTLAKNELLTISIIATVSTQSCAWELGMDEIVDGQSETEIIQAEQPFRLSGVAPLDSYSQRYVSSFQYGNTDRSHAWSPEPYEWFCQISCNIAYWRPIDTATPGSTPVAGPPPSSTPVAGLVMVSPSG